MGDFGAMKADQPFGLIDDDERISDQTFTNSEVTMLTLEAPVVSSGTIYRRKITATLEIGFSASSEMEIRFYRDAILIQTYIELVDVSGGKDVVTAVFVDPTAKNTADTYTIRVIRTSGSGTGTIYTNSYGLLEGV